MLMVKRTVATSSPMPFGIEGADWNVLEIERDPVAEQHHLDEPHEQRRDLVVKVAIGVEADAARDHALAPARAFDVRPARARCRGSEGISADPARNH
jgi:hypothetical protein